MTRRGTGRRAGRGFGSPRRCLSPALLSLAALLLSAPGSAAAAAAVPRLPTQPARKPDYKLTVSVGLAGHCRLGWVPVHVAIEAGKGFEGHLVAALRPRVRGPVLFQTRRPLRLAAGNKTDYHLYIRHESPHLGRAPVEVYLERGRSPLKDTLRRRTVNLVPPHHYLVCVVSDKLGVLSGLRTGGQARQPRAGGRTFDAGREFVVAQPGLRELPEKAAGYGGVDFLVLYETPFDVDKLSPARLAAIVDYVRGGGVLVVSGRSPGWFARRELRSLVPLRPVTAAPRGEAGKLLSMLGSRYGSKFSGKSKAGMTVHRFRAPGFTPDAQRGFAVGPCGLGTALVWRLDPRDPALRAWPGMFNLWGDLGRRFYSGKPRENYGFGYGGGHTQESGPVARARRLTEMLNLSRERSVSALLVVFLVVFYLVLVGPVNYFVLRRLDMRALSIVTIPLLAATFVLLTFAVGYMFRGVTTVGRRVTLAVTSSGSARAGCRTYQSVFPAGAMLADVGTDGRGLLAPQLKPGMTGERRGAFALANEDRFVLERHPLRMWEMAHFLAESVRRLGGPLRLEDLSGQDVRTSGRYRLTNNSSLKLKDAFLVSSVTGGRYAWLGEVPPGKVLEGRLKRWQQGAPRGAPRAPGLTFKNALVLWLEGKLGGTSSYAVPGQKDTFAHQAAEVIRGDPRLAQGRFSGRARMLLFAKAGEELEPVRLNGRPVRGERLDVLAVSAERELRK